MGFTEAEFVPNPVAASISGLCDVFQHADSIFDGYLYSSESLRLG